MRRALLGGLAVLAVAAGCGKDDSEEVRDKLEQYQQATASKDYKALCEQVISEGLADKLKLAGVPCEQAFRTAYQEIRSPQLTVQRVDVDGERATALVQSTAMGQEPSTDTVALVKEDGGWRVDDLAVSQRPKRTRPPAP